MRKHGERAIACVSETVGDSPKAEAFKAREASKRMLGRRTESARSDDPGKRSERAPPSVGQTAADRPLADACSAREATAATLGTKAEGGQRSESTAPVSGIANDLPMEADSRCTRTDSRKAVTANSQLSLSAGLAAKGTAVRTIPGDGTRDERPNSPLFVAVSVLISWSVSNARVSGSGAEVRIRSVQRTPDVAVTCRVGTKGPDFVNGVIAHAFVVSGGCVHGASVTSNVFGGSPWV
jgi:hypothetical protein